jgi:hypothetical protein
VLDPEVNADYRRRRGKLHRVGHVYGEGHVPASARIAGDGHRGRVDRRHVNIWPRPHELQPHVHLGEEQLPVAVPESGTGVLGGLPSPAGLVPRGTGPAGEEVAERCLLVPDRLLERDTGDLVQPPQFLAGLHGSQVGVGLREICSGLLVVIPGVTPREGAVPYDPDAAERAVKHARLFEVRVGPALIRRTHELILPGVTVMDKLTRERGSGVSSPA